MPNYNTASSFATHPLDPAHTPAVECLLLEAGFPVRIHPHDDHEARLVTLLGRLQLLGRSEHPVISAVRQRLLNHIAAHLHKLSFIKPQAAQLWRRHLTRLELIEYAKARAFLARMTAQRRQRAQQLHKPGGKNG